jgi:CHAT domain-containing protein
LTAAVRLAPNDYNHIIDLRRQLSSEFGLASAFRRLFQLTGNRLLYECVMAENFQQFATLHRMNSSSARECAAFALATFQQANEQEYATLRAMASRPYGAYSAALIAKRMREHGRAKEADAILDRALTLPQTVRQRAGLATLRASYAEIQRAVERSGYPALRLWRVVDDLSREGTPQRAAELEAVAYFAESYGSFAECGHVMSSVMAASIDHGEINNALRVAQRATSCADRSRNLELQARIRIWQARAQVKAGSPRRAIALLKEAEPIALRAQYDYNIADLYHNLAHAYEALADRANAQTAVVKFVDAAKPLENTPLRVVSLRDAGIIYWESGQPREARRFFDAMVKRIDVEDHDQYWAGEYFERAGDWSRARHYYKAALQTPGDSARKTAALTRLYLSLGAIDSAEITARMHDGLAQTPEEVPLIPEILLARGRASEALKGAQAWASQQETRGNVVGIINANLQVADIARSASDTGVSHAAARKALQLARPDSNLDAQARALVVLGDHKRALQVAQRSANPIVLADVWAEIAGRTLRPDAIDSALAARGRVARHFEHGFDRARFRNSVATLLDRAVANAILTRNAKALWNYSIRRKAGRAPTHSYRAQPGHILVDYSITDSVSGALVVSGRGVRVVRLPIDKKQTRALIERLRSATHSSFGTIDLARARFDLKSAQQAYEMLIRPLQLESAEAIDFVADDALHFMPFDALYDGRQFLIDRAAVSFLATADADVAPVNVKGVDFIPGNAPGVDREAGYLKTLVGRVDVARELTGQGNVIHIAAHAFADAVNPLSAYVELPARKLTINEIEQARLHADLVVLTACETVYGKLYSGGPFGISRAFGAAGAKSVVATLWPVGDNAADFTRAFYSALKVTTSPSIALREAKLSLKRQTSNPLLWAPYVVIGNHVP